MDDFEKAMKIYNESGKVTTAAFLELAKKRHPEALYMLGNHWKEKHKCGNEWREHHPSLYQRKMAYLWYFLAESEGHKKAKIEMDKLESELTKSNIEEAKQDAWKWAENYYLPTQPSSNSKATPSMH